MSSNRNPGRVAGLVYALLVVTGPFTLLYIPSALIVRGNATATASNILTHEMLFRTGIVADLIGSVFFIFVGLVFYRLFKGVSAAQALLLLSLVLVSTAVGFLNVLNNIAALLLFRGEPFLSVFDRAQLNALAMLFLRLHGQGILMDEVFWGLWLLPFGWLVIRSGVIPKFLGGWLILNGFAYIGTSFTGLLAPQYEGAVSKYTFPVLFGELAVMLWLIVFGARPRLAETQAVSAANAT